MAEPTSASIPSLDQFLSDAKPINPGVSDEQLSEAYYQHFNVAPTSMEPKATLPSLDEFMQDVKPLNKGVPDDQLKAVWFDRFGRQGARETKPSFWESFKSGMKQGSLGVQESYEGTKERLLDPNDPLKKFTREAGDELAKAAAKHAVPSDLSQQPALQRLTDPEYLGNLLGNVVVQSAPSLAGAVAGGVVGGPVGAMAGMAGTTFFQEAGQSYREAYDKYIKAGFSEEKAHENAYHASGMAGAVSGLVNSLAVPATLMAPFKGVLKNLLAKYAANVAVDAGDQVTGNIVARSTYDPGRDITTGLPEAVVGSALLGGPETMAGVQAAVKMQRTSPDQGLTPGPTASVDENKTESVLRTDPLTHAEPVLNTKSVDDAITKATETANGVPIDLDALEKEVGGEVDIELKKSQADMDAVLKQTQLQTTQAELDNLSVKKTVDVHEGQGEFDVLGNLERFNMKAVSPQDLPPAPIEPVSSPQGFRSVLTKPQYDAVSDLLALDDVKVILFDLGDKPKKLYDGFVDRQNPNAIYLNAKSVTDPATIAFHEVQHLMQRSEIFDGYREAILQELQPGAKGLARQVHGNLNKNLLFEEIMADIHGDAMTRPSFHEKLIQKLEEQRGAEDTKNALLTFIDDLRQKIAKVTQFIQRKVWTDADGKSLAERYVKNLEKVHDALASALATHYRQKIETKRAVELEKATKLISTVQTKPQQNVTTEPVVVSEKDIATSDNITLPATRTSEDVQKEIDDIETEMHRRGEQTSNLYDPHDEQAKILEGYQNWKPMPEKLAKLYRTRDEIDTREKKRFHEAVVRQSGLSREDAERALKELSLHPDALTSHFSETLKRWNVDTTRNLGKLYNHFLHQKYGDQNMGEDFDDKFATFRIEGPPARPTLTASTKRGHPLEQDVLNKVGLVWNAVAKHAGKKTHNFEMKDGKLKLQGTSIEDESLSFMPSTPQNFYPVSEPTRIDTLIRKLQDKNVDLKRLIEAIQKAGHVVHDDLNPVFREEMYHKRAEQRATDFTNNELKPLVDSMRSNNVTLEQLDQYAHARHVLDDNLNQRLQQMNPDLAETPAFEKLAGITDEEARAIIGKSNKKVMDSLMRRVDAMVEKTRNMMVEYGLESQERIDGWRDQYRSYVPLHREGFEEEGKTTGTGMSVRGSTAKDRLGSALKVVDVIANVAQARDQVISRGEKMRPVIALAGLFLKYPNKDIAKLDKYAPVQTVDPTTGLSVTIPGDLADYKRPMIRRRDPETGEVKSFPDPSYKGRDNVVNFRIGGKDYAIIFNERNVRAMEIAKGLKNLETPPLNSILKAVAPFTRYLASINTQYNPIFGIVNFIRDAQFAMLTLQSTELAGTQAKIATGALTALRGIYQDARAIRRGEIATSSTAQLWERFEHVGGPTGYRDLFFSSTERAEDLQRMLSKDGWSHIRNPAQFVKRVESTALFQWLSDYNLAMENAIRLSVFKAGTEAGMTDIKAASIAKNITVNFNKKGQLGAQMGSLYAFFNASVQGTTRILETMFRRTEDKLGFTLTPSGRQILVGGVLLGALQTFALAMAGFEDDEPPEYLKNRNLVIPMPGTEKGYAMIPMPLGFNLLPTVGRLAAESVHAGLSGRSPKLMDKASTLAEAMTNTFSPLGGSATILQELAPTALDPVVALKENTDWTGKSIYQEDHSSLRKTPGHTRAKDTATIWAYGLSKFINMVSGGSEYVPGKLSPSPDAIDYLIQQATGGIGREISKAAQLGRSTVTGEEVPAYKVPLVGRFAGTAGGSTGVRDKFYDNVRSVNEAAMEIEGRAKNGEPFSDVLKERPEGRLKTQALRFQKQIAELRDEKKKLLEKGNAKDEVQRKEQQITNVMKLFNDQVERLQKPRQ